MRIEGLAFAGLASAESVALGRFFRDVLGVEGDVDDEVWRLSFPDGTALAIVPPSDHLGDGRAMLGFLVDDVEAATAELASRGVEPAGDLLHGGGFRYRHFAAPGGLVFELLDRRA